MPERTLPHSAVSYSRTRSGLEALLVVIVAVLVIVTVVPGNVRPISTAAVVGFAGLTAIIDIPFIDPARTRSVSFGLEGDFLRIRHGIFVRQDIVLPTDRILNITVVQGPILRVFGLAKIRFATISHFVPLGPLDVDEALRFRGEVQARQDLTVPVTSDEG